MHGGNGPHGCSFDNRSKLRQRYLGSKFSQDRLGHGLLISPLRYLGSKFSQYRLGRGPDCPWYLEPSSVDP